MRYIILKTHVTDNGTLAFYGLAEVTQSASGFFPKWIDLVEAKTNCAEPEKCDLLSFECEGSALTLLSESKMDQLRNIACIGVDAPNPNP
jgi:hypothetical protein